MYANRSDDDPSYVSAGTAVRHLIVFQLKLALDAVRDFFFSPLSILVFLLDLLLRPPLERSLYLRLMMLGRRSDRLINLFDEYRDAGHFTVDEAVDALERQLQEGRERGESTSGP